jgi:hypothetical protein
VVDINKYKKHKFEYGIGNLIPSIELVSFEKEMFTVQDDEVMKQHSYISSSVILES